MVLNYLCSCVSAVQELQLTVWQSAAPTNPFCSAPKSIRAFWPYAACRNPFQQKRALISQMQNCSIVSEGALGSGISSIRKSGRHDPRHCRKGRIVSTSSVSIHYTRQRTKRSACEFLGFYPTKIDGLNLRVVNLPPEALKASSEVVWHRYQSTTAPQYW